MGRSTGIVRNLGIASIHRIPMSRPRGPDRLVVVVLTGHRRAEVAPCDRSPFLSCTPSYLYPDADQPDIHRFCHSSPRCANVSTAPPRLHIRVNELKPDSRKGV